jgi:hypothetical protein
MKFLIFIQRIVVAAIAAFVFHGTTLLLTLLPRIVENHHRFMVESFSSLVQIFYELVPLTWFPAVGALFTFWFVFRETANLSVSPRLLWFSLFGFLVGAGMVVLRPIVYANLPALSAPDPSGVTVGFNYAMVAIGIVIVIADARKKP